MSEAAQNYEDVTRFTLDDEKEKAILAAQTECTFIWSNKEGWPVGVIMSYVYVDGKFWMTASSQRARVSAVRRDPRVSVCVTSTGSKMPRNATVTYKGTCRLLNDADTKVWFYPALAKALRPGDEVAQTQFANFLDSPRRVIFEVTPTQRIGYDGAKMAEATKEWLDANG